MLAAKPAHPRRPDRGRFVLPLMTGYSTTAVPMQARATVISRTPPKITGCPGLGDDVVRIAHRAIQGEGSVSDKGEQVEHAPRQARSSSVAVGTRFVAVVRSVVMSFSLERIGQHIID